MTQSMTNDFVCVGKIIKPQGIKGEVKILPAVDIPAIFNGKHPLFVERAEMKIEHASFRLGYGFVKFAEISDRNEAEKFRNKKVFVTKEEFKKVSVDHFLIDELVGSVIYDETGAMVGQIMGVTDYGFDDILIIKEDGILYEVPFRKAIFQVHDGELSVVRAEYEGAKVVQE